MTTPPDLTGVVPGIARFIHAHTTLERRDRLWPAHSAVFATNPLGLAYGACGIALFLNEVEGGIDDDVRAWLLGHRLTTQDYAPGLWTGLSGIAYALAELGSMEEAERTMRLAATSPLRFADSSIVYGAAGYGWANLYFADRTGDDRYLEQADEAARHLLASATREGDTLAWTHALDGKVHFGLGVGSSGVALFLLELARRTGDPATLAAARAALEYDLAHGVTRSGEMGWVRFVDDILVEPYWLHGSGGVGTVVLRFAEQLREERYATLVDEIARSVHVHFAVLPGQWEGMAGIAEYLIDAARFTGKAEHREAAEQLVRSIMLYALDRDGGIAFPGRILQRISTDVATGSAGVGLFLHRLQAGGRRLFTDLPGQAVAAPVAMLPRAEEPVAFAAD